MSAITTNATAETRRRVQEQFIDPLQEAGLVKGRGRTVAGLEEMQERLRGRLAYLDQNELAILREVALEIAKGTLRNVWPDEAIIYNQALQIRRPPPSFSEKVQRYMRSAPGRAAVDRGYGGVLLEWLRAHAGVPNEYSLAQIRLEAEDMRRTRERVARDVSMGRRVDDEERQRIDRLGKLDHLARALAFPELEDA